MDPIDIILGAQMGAATAEGKYKNVFVAATGTVGEVTLGTGWSAADPHSIAVTVSGYTVTSKTMISVLPDANVIKQMKQDGTTTIYISNNNGTVMAYAIGLAPTVSLTLPVLFTEVD